VWAAVKTFAKLKPKDAKIKAVNPKQTRPARQCLIIHLRLMQTKHYTGKIIDFFFNFVQKHSFPNDKKAPQKKQFLQKNRPIICFKKQ
jgi:hypothetical protein